MSRDRFDRARDLFHQAMELSALEREDWLREHCGPDDGLLREVQELVRAADRRDDPLERGVLSSFSPPDTVLADQLPKVAGYEVLRRLAIGGQAIVFEAVQLSTEQTVAIKLLRTGLFATAEEEQRFAQEVTTLARIQHPHIVPIIDRGETESGIPYLVTQFVNGWPVDKYVDDRLIAEGKPTADPHQLLALFVKIAGAVQVAHDHGVVHRDLKPSNILVDQHGEPRLLDFGIAKNLRDSPEQPFTLTGGFVGSLPWASPEQAGGRSSRTDHRTDIYSLGVILYQMLTGGEFPYCVVGNMRDVLNNILNSTPTPPSEVLRTDPASTSGTGVRIHPTIEAIVMKALQKSPDERHQSARELADEIRNYLGGKSPDAGDRVGAVGSVGSMRPWVLGALGLVLFACLWLNRGALLDGTAPENKVRNRPSRPARLSPTATTGEAQAAVDVLLQSEQYDQLCDEYARWRLRNPTIDASECVRAIFEHGRTLYEHGIPDRPAADYAQQLYEVVVASHPCIPNEEPEIVDICAAMRVKLAYLVSQPPDGSAGSLAGLYRSLDYSDRLTRQFPSDLRYVRWRAHIRRALGENLLVADRPIEAAKALERSLRTLFNLPRNETDQPPDQHDWAEVASLILALPDDGESHATALKFISKPVEQGTTDPDLLAVAALSALRSRDAALATKRLRMMRGPEPGLDPRLLQVLAMELSGQQPNPTELSEIRLSIADRAVMEPSAFANRLLLSSLADYGPNDFEQAAGDIKRHLLEEEYAAAATVYRTWRPRSVLRNDQAMSASAVELAAALVALADGQSEVDRRIAFQLGLSLLDGNRLDHPNAASGEWNAILTSIPQLCRCLSATAMSVDHQYAFAQRLARLLEALSGGTNRDRAAVWNAASAAVFVSLAESSKSLDNIDEAIGHYLRAAKHFRAADSVGHASAESASLWLQLSDARTSDEALPALVDRASKLHRANPDRGDILTVLGTGHYRCGRHHAALKTLEDARRLAGGDDNRNWLVTALSHKALQQHSESEQFLSLVEDLAAEPVLARLFYASVRSRN